MSRRATLGVLNDSAINARSSSASKSRQSLGPTRLMDGPPSLPKPSSIVAAASLGGAATTTTMNVTNRRQSNPRSSSAGMQRMTLSQTNTTGSRSRIGADPRNVNDRKFITTNIGILIEYLSAHGYDHFINPKILSSPSGKDFNNIVQFLFRQIDPNLTCPGKFEDEIISIFKFLKYPFNISKNGLSAVGSPHSWPQLLASLVWIIELLEYDEEIVNEQEINYNLETTSNATLLTNLNINNPNLNNLSPDEENQLTQKLFYIYLKKAYMSFLSGDDETYSQLEQQFIQLFDMKNTLLLQDLERLKTENEQLGREFTLVESRRSRLSQLRDKKKDYEDDKNKFQILIEQLRKHKEMAELKKKNKLIELEKINQHTENIETEINLLKDTISRQELSPEDVKKMCEEKEHLQVSLQNTTEQLSQLQKKVWDNEVILRDKVQNIEESVRLFNSMSEDLDYAISNAGTTPEKANIKKKIRIELDTRAKTRNDLIQTNIRKDILPRLHRMKGVLSDATVQLRGEIIIRQDTLEELELENVKLTESKTTIENKIKRSEDIYKKERAAIEMNSSQYEQQIDELESRLMELRNTTQEDNILTQLKRQIHEMKQNILFKREQHLKKKKEINETIIQSVTVLTEYKEKMKQKLGELKELMDQKLQQTLSIEINETDGIVVRDQIPLKKMVIHHQLLSSKKLKNTFHYTQNQNQNNGNHGNQLNYSMTTSPRLTYNESPIQENLRDDDVSLEYGSLHDRLQCEGDFEASFLE